MPKPAKPAADAAPRPRGRPLVYPNWEAWKNNPDSIEELCDRVRDGESLREIAKNIGASQAMLWRWIEADENRSARARAARIDSAKTFDDEAFRLINDAPDNFGLAKAKELAHHLRWRASKIAPRDYGDRTEITGAGGGPLQVELTAEEAARRVAFVLASGLQAKSKPGEPDTPSKKPPTRSD